eukprot:5236871-Pyramimonas_sp.AAC.1
MPIARSCFLSSSWYCLFWSAIFAAVACALAASSLATQSSILELLFSLLCSGFRGPFPFQPRHRDRGEGGFGVCSSAAQRQDSPSLRRTCQQSCSRLLPRAAGPP